MPDPTLSKTAIIYTRVSTEEQKKGHSLETQLEDCTDFVKRNGWRLKRTYRDVETARTTDREQYQRLLRDAGMGLFEVLVVWKVDRFTRNTLDGLSDLKRLLGDLGTELFSVTERIDTKTAEGRKNLRDLISGAEFESDRLRERVMPGMRRGVLKGHWQGARYPRYGFRYDKPNKKLVEIPDEIQALRKVYKHRAEGMAVYSIALRLADEGIRNRVGRLFTTHQLEVMLKCAFYVDGHLVWSDVRSEHSVVKPVIDRETWEKAQEVNQARRHESKDVRPGRTTSRYVLQGALKCRFCGANMVGQRQTANHRTGKRLPWYTCGQRVSRTRKACRGQYVKGVVAEGLAFELLKRIMQHPQLIELTKKKIREALEHGHPLLSKRVRELRGIIRGLRQDQAKWRDAYYKEAVTTQQFKEENLRLVREQETAEQELRVAQTKLEGADVFKGRVEQVFELLQDFGAVWEKMTPVQQRVVYRGVFNHLYVEGARWSRQFKVTEFSLKEPFRSWYDGRAWEGPLVVREGDSVVVTSNKDKELCESYIFAPTAVR